MADLEDEYITPDMFDENMKKQSGKVEVVPIPVGDRTYNKEDIKKIMNSGELLTFLSTHEIDQVTHTLTRVLLKSIKENIKALQETLQD